MLQQLLLILDVLNFSCALKAGPMNATVTGIWQACSDERHALAAQPARTLQLEQAPTAAPILIPELVFA